MGYYKNFESFFGKTAAIEHSGREFTYEQLSLFCSEIEQKVPSRSLIFSFCRNCIDSMAGYIAFLNNRIVPVLLDYHINEELAANLIQAYHPHYLYVPKEMAEQYGSYYLIAKFDTYVLLKTEWEDEIQLFDELALLLTTSGSTGSPKLVRQSYQNIDSNARSIAEYLSLDNTERPITNLPMNYTYGLSIINSHLLKGATILLTDRSIVEKEFWEFFKEAGATSFGGVPYTYEALKKMRFFGMDLPSLRTMTQAGGKLSPELHREFAEYALSQGKHFIVMYGQTEATARMAYLPSEKSLEKYGSMGIAIPGGKFTLVDEDGKEITEENITGELVYRGDNVTLGYAECVADLSKGDDRQGTLVTGDMAVRDKDGYYFIVGRKKRFLKIFGNRVNLDEAERLLKGKFPNEEFACTGVDDKMLIYLKENAEIDTEIKVFLSQKTGLNQRAFEVKILKEIPKNEAGKIMYAQLK